VQKLRSGFADKLKESSWKMAFFLY
jgi:hypothetical protein